MTVKNYDYKRTVHIKMTANDEWITEEDDFLIACDEIENVRSVQLFVIVDLETASTLVELIPSGIPTIGLCRSDLAFELKDSLKLYPSGFKIGRINHKMHAGVYASFFTLLGRLSESWMRIGALVIFVSDDIDMRQDLLRQCSQFGILGAAFGTPDELILKKFLSKLNSNGHSFRNPNPTDPEFSS